MKKAREIVIPEDRPLTAKEFLDYREHAIRSSSWYASEYVRSEKQIIDKLLKKGYIRDDVTYINEKGNEESHNIVDEVIAFLKETYLIDDDAYARGLIERYRYSRRGERYIKNKLYEKGIDSEIIDKLLEESREPDEVYEAIDYLAERYKNSSAYRREENSFKRKQKLTTHLISRGYSFSDIQTWEEFKEEE